MFDRPGQSLNGNGLALTGAGAGQAAGLTVRVSGAARPADAASQPIP
ncbi:hypothetical protein ACVXG7_29520 [Enterobacter hormaechei]